MESIFDNLLNSEDAVVYSIYFPLPTSDQISFLQEISTLILSELNQYLNEYIWQKDPFELRIVKNESGKRIIKEFSFLSFSLFILNFIKIDPSYPFLHGKTKFGDCIDDEWFIVFLLRQISLKYKEAVIRYLKCMMI